MILISGANGGIGRATLKKLSETGDLPLRAMVRSPKNAEALAASGIDTVLAGFADPGSLDKALVDVERALLLSPHHPDKVALENNFIDAAVRTGRKIKIVKISGLATVLDSPSQSGRWHAQIEQHLQNSGLPFSCLRPPFFMQNLLRSVAPAVAAHGEFAAPMADARIAMIDVNDVAAVAAALLQKPEPAEQYYEITGPEALSFNDIAWQLSGLLNRPVSYRDISLAAMREQLQKSPMADWHIEIAMEFWTLLRENHAATVTNTVKTLTGKPAGTFKHFAQQHLSQFISQNP